MTKQFFLLMGLVFLVSACRDTGTAVPTPTLLPIPILETVIESTAVSLPTDISVTETAVPIVTAVTEQEVTATDTSVAADTPIIMPLLTVPPVQPALVNEPVIVALTDGARAIYTFEGTRFEPRLFFVEASENLDTAVTVYAASASNDTDLTSLTAEATADNAGPGIPEMVVFTPDRDGEFSLMVTGKGEGTAVVHSVDSRTTTSASALAAGEVGKSASFNNDAQATYIFVAPVGQVDLTLRAVSLDGEQITEANFGGPGSAEALFVLPPQSAGFNFEVTETNGAPAEYHLFVGSGVPLKSEE